MKPTKEEKIREYEDKIEKAKNALQPYQEYYENNKNYDGDNFEKKLAIEGAKYLMSVNHHRIKTYRSHIKRIEKGEARFNKEEL